jgi:hypothetical protein
MVNKLSKMAGGGADFAKLMSDAAKSGDQAFIKAGDAFGDLLSQINKGDAGPKEILEAMATTDFSMFRGSVEGLLQMFKDAESKGTNMQSIFKVKAELFDMLDGALGGVMKTIKGILAAMGPWGLLVAALGLLLNYMISAVMQAKELRQELGTSVMESARLSANMEAAAWTAARFGGSMDQGRAAVKALADSFGDLSVISLATSSAVGKLVANTGLAGAEAADLLKVMTDVTGQSIETNVNTLLALDNLAESSKVAPAKIMASIARDTDMFARAGERGAQALFRAAIQAEKIGLELSKLDSLADSFLDVESVMRNQQMLSGLLGKNMDFTKMIQLSNASDTAGMQQEIAKQLQGIDVSALDRFTQNKLISTFPGMSLSDIVAIQKGEPVESGKVTPPVAKDTLEAANKTNELITAQTSEIKALKESNIELMTKLNRNIGRMGAS